jgi:hypothetical protein
MYICMFYRISFSLWIKDYFFFLLDYSTAHTLVTLSILRSAPFRRHRHLRASLLNTLCTSIVIRTSLSLVSIYLCLCSSK